MATPKFRRHDSHKKARLSENWRKPRGRQNKLRLNKKGYGRPINVGYGSPRATRGEVNGLKPVMVATLSALETINKKNEGAVISAKVGGRKREMLLLSAKEKGITILNLDPEKQLAALNKRLAERKEKIRSKREKKNLEAKAKKEGSKNLEAKAEAEGAKGEEGSKEPKKQKEISAEDKAEAEKRAKEKILTKKV